MKNIKFLNFLLIFLSFSCFAKATVIYNSSLNEKIDAEKVKKIYTGRILFWDDGARVFPSILDIDKSESIIDFLANNINMGKQEYLMHWRRILFSGKGYPPTNLGTDEEVIDFVSKNKGAIGVISKRPANLPRTLKILK